MRNKRLLNTLYLIALCLGLTASNLSWGQPWTYDFGTGTGTANNSNSGTGNTSFFSSTPSNGGTYRIRIGTSGGALALANPGTSLGNGSEVQLNASTSTSTNKFGVYDWSSPSNFSYLKAKVRTTSTGNGNINISLGSNTIASDNQGYTSHYNNSLASMSITYTSGSINSVVRRISGANTTISSHGFTKDTDQQIEIYANNSSSSTTYTRSGTSYTLATKTWDLWVDGNRVVTNGATAGTLSIGNITGFTFFAESSTSNAAYLYIDDIEYSNFLPGPPTAPNMSAITPGNTQLSVAFTAPSSNGGSAITNYEYSTNGGTSFTACSPAQTTSPIVITGLTNGTSYNVQLRAVNANGSGAATSSTAATPYTTPDAPVITGITPGNTTLTVDFTAPSSNGGSAITNYKYSTDGGSSFTACSPAQTTSPITISGLTNGTTYNVQIKAVNVAGDGLASTSSSGTPTSLVPTITVSNTGTPPINLGTVVGLNPSSSFQYTVEGSNLTGDVTITAPSGFEVSKDDVSYSSSISYTQSGGALPINSFVYVRFNPSSINGSNSGNITHTSSGATTQTVGITAVVIATQPTTASSVTFGAQTTSSVVVNFSGGNGSRRIVVIKSGSAVTFTPTDATAYTGVNAAFGTATDQDSGNKIVYDGTGNTVTVTGLSTSTTYHFAVYEYNVGTSSSQNYYATAGLNNVFILDNAVYTADNTGTDLTENFNTLANSGTSSTMPTGWYFSESGSNANATYSASTGSSTAGETYSFGTTSSDRAIGSIASGSLISSIGTKLINTSGETITSLRISFTGEQWRLGATGRQDKLAFSYSTDATSLTTGSWTVFTDLDFSSPVTTGTTGALDGNLTANRTQITSTITGLSLTNGATLWFKWVDIDISGSDDALAIDDIVITPFSNTITASSPNPTPGTVNNLNINNDATLIGNVTVSGKLYIESGKKITLNGHKLTINGAVVGTPTIVSDGSSNLEIGGTGSIDTLNFDQTTSGTTNKLKDLTINRTGATIKLGNALQIADNGTVTVNAGTLASGGNLTLTSTLSSTARIATLPLGTSITGTVIAQRYMIGGFGKRGWRTMSSSTKNATYQQLADDILVTGPGGSTNGFDANTTTASILYYEESTSRGFKNITGLNQTWPTGKGALVFYRGTRNQTSSIGSSAVIPNDTVIDYVGEINSGDIVVNLDYVASGTDQGWNLLGNPYPSQIDWSTVTKTNFAGNVFYIYDASGGSYIDNLTNGDIIKPGQGFFVEATGTGQSITFKETDKTGSTSGTAYFKTASQFIDVFMRKDTMKFDRVRIAFSTTANKNYIVGEDAKKFNNSGYNIAAVTPNQVNVQYHSVPALSTNQSDTFDILVNSATTGTYTLDFSNINSITNSKYILLKDKSNNNWINIRTNPQYVFTINTSNPTTFGNRFQLIVTDQFNPLPVRLLSFEAKASGKNNKITWHTTSEKNLLSYEVQRSSDNRVFETIAIVQPTNNGSNSIYNVVDENLTAALPVMYYRLKIVESKLENYSTIIAVDRSLTHTSIIAIHPNPVTNTFSISNHEQIESGKILDLNGKELMPITNVTQPIDISELTRGVYVLVITTTHGETISTKLVKQ